MVTKIQNPVLDTLTVELSVIKVGEKQMTITVFNQLYEEYECWDENYNILYPIWGRVNRDNEWIVLQKDCSLFKCRMPSHTSEAFYEDFMLKMIMNDRNYIFDKFPKLTFALGKNYSNFGDSEGIQKLYQLFKHRSAYISSEDLELILPEFDKKYTNKLKQKFRDHNWKINKYNSMVDELKNSRHLFIAA